jgi:hypothetical protein
MMSPILFRLVLLLATVFCLAAGDQPKTQPKATAGGSFVGRSGKPMAKFRLILGEVTGDADLLYAKIKLPERLPTTVTDDKGQFQFTDVPPGLWAVLYQPAASSKVLPAEISILALAAVAKSPFPLLRDTQIGDTPPPNPERPWAKGAFTLLKGHTFFADGPNMKIWNATARFGASGPFMEIRKGVIVREQFTDKGQVKLIAWSY